MSTESKTKITIEHTVQAPVEKVWQCWTEPEHIKRWNSASPDWHTPHAENDLREGGTFTSRMEARDGSMGFDFGGVYDAVRMHEHIAYTLGDGRKVTIDFAPREGATHVTETFEAEGTNPVEMQRGGWQAILDSFKRYTEAQGSGAGN